MISYIGNLLSHDLVTLDVEWFYFCLHINAVLNFIKAIFLILLIVVFHFVV